MPDSANNYTFAPNEKGGARIAFPRHQERGRPALRAHPRRGRLREEDQGRSVAEERFLRGYSRTLHTKNLSNSLSAYGAPPLYL